MKYRYMLPADLQSLVAAGDSPEVERLVRHAQSTGMLRAIRDWPHFKQPHEVYALDEIMKAAKEACSHLLLEPLEEEETVMTNSMQTFSMLFVQSYVWAYTGVVEAAQRSNAEILALVELVGSRSDSVALEVLNEIAELAAQHPRHT